jgi:hypothetical protein
MYQHYTTLKGRGYRDWYLWRVKLEAGTTQEGGITRAVKVNTALFPKYRGAKISPIAGVLVPTIYR